MTTPRHAGELCDTLDQTLRSVEMGLDIIKNSIVIIIRDEAWRRRTIRTGEIVECTSFLDMLTAPPLKGFYLKADDLKQIEWYCTMIPKRWRCSKRR